MLALLKLDSKSESRFAVPNFLFLFLVNFEICVVDDLLVGKFYRVSFILDFDIFIAKIKGWKLSGVSGNFLLC